MIVVIMCSSDIYYPNDYLLIVIENMNLLK